MNDTRPPASEAETPKNSNDTISTPEAPAHSSSLLTWLLIAAAMIIIMILLFNGGGYGEQTTQKFDPGDATAVHLQAGVGTLTITQGNTTELTVFAPEKYLQDIRVETHNNTITIGIDRPWYQQLFFPSPKKESVSYTLTVLTLSNLQIDGVMDVSTTNALTGTDLNVELNGAANIDLELDTDTLTLKLNGAGSAALRGRADAQSLTMDGTGDIHARALIGLDVTAMINGAGDAEVYATDSLTAEVNGAGNISYAGDPDDVSQEINGVGSINAIDDDYSPDSANDALPEDENTNAGDPTTSA